MTKCRHRPWCLLNLVLAVFLVALVEKGLFINWGFETRQLSSWDPMPVCSDLCMKPVTYSRALYFSLNQSSAICSTRFMLLLL